MSRPNLHARLVVPALPSTLPSLLPPWAATWARLAKRDPSPREALGSGRRWRTVIRSRRAEAKDIEGHQEWNTPLQSLTSLLTGGGPTSRTPHSQRQRARAKRAVCSFFRGWSHDGLEGLQEIGLSAGRRGWESEHGSLEARLEVVARELVLLQELHRQLTEGVHGLPRAQGGWHPKACCWKRHGICCFVMRFAGSLQPKDVVAHPYVLMRSHLSEQQRWNAWTTDSR